MSRRFASSRFFLTALLLVCGAAKALPIDDVEALCSKKGVYNVQVFFPASGDRYVYWCDSKTFELCPGGRCQPGEEIEVGGSDCPSGGSWDQICNRDRFPECPSGSGWDPVYKKCHCDGTLVSPYCADGRCFCNPAHPNGGSGDHGRYIDCKEYASALCTNIFELDNLKKHITKPCYSVADCWDEWSKAQASGPGNLTDIGACLQCVLGCRKYDPDRDGVPEPLSESDFHGETFCKLELGGGMQRLQDYWNRQRNIKKSRQKSKEQREIEVEIKKGNPRDIDLR